MGLARDFRPGMHGFIPLRAEDVTNTLDLALQASGCDQVHVVHKPRLLSDNGSSYVSGDLAEWLQDKGMQHSRGAPYHPQTQGKIERWHQTLKNRILLENYFLPGDLEAQIEAFVDHYNHQRYHERVVPPFLTGCGCRTYAAIFSFCAGVIPPMPIFGRSLL